VRRRRRTVVVGGAATGRAWGVRSLQRRLNQEANNRLIGPFSSLGPRKGEVNVNILTVNLLFSTLVFWIAARLYVLPRLHDLPPRRVLLPILLLHSLRHLGLMFLAPGATYAGLPPAFAYPAAFGDLLAAVLAVIAIPAVARQARSARFLVWLFNVEGTLDLFAAIVLANVHNVASYMGPAYWIPAFWVPALIVTHYITFIVLRMDWRSA
jgi:hypothetical protein